MRIIFFVLILNNLRGYDCGQHFDAYTCSNNYMGDSCCVWSYNSNLCYDQGYCNGHWCNNSTSRSSSCCSYSEMYGNYYDSCCNGSSEVTSICPGTYPRCAGAFCEGCDSSDFCYLFGDHCYWKDDACIDSGYVSCNCSECLSLYQCQKINTSCKWDIDTHTCHSGPGNRNVGKESFLSRFPFMIIIIVISVGVSIAAIVVVIIMIRACFKRRSLEQQYPGGGGGGGGVEEEEFPPPLGLGGGGDPALRQVQWDLQQHQIFMQQQFQQNMINQHMHQQAMHQNNFGNNFGSFGNFGHH